MINLKSQANCQYFYSCRQRTYSNMLSLQNAAQSSTAHHIITVLRANIQILEEVSVIGARAHPAISHLLLKI